MSGLSDHARRLLAVLPVHGEKTRRRANHDAGLAENPGKVASRILEAEGLVELVRGESQTRLRLTDAGREAQAALFAEGAA